MEIKIHLRNVIFICNHYIHPHTHTHTQGEWNLSMNAWMHMCILQNKFIHTNFPNINSYLFLELPLPGLNSSDHQIHNLLCSHLSQTCLSWSKKFVVSRRKFENKNKGIFKIWKNRNCKIWSKSKQKWTLKLFFSDNLIYHPAVVACR